MCSGFNTPRFTAASNSEVVHNNKNQNELKNQLDGDSALLLHFTQSVLLKKMNIDYMEPQ